MRAGGDEEEQLAAVLAAIAVFLQAEPERPQGEAPARWVHAGRLEAQRHLTGELFLDSRWGRQHVR